MPNPSRLLPFLLIAYVLEPQPACAVVDVQGDAASIQVVADHAHVSEVLSALSKIVFIQHRMTTDLDTVIDGMYRGPLKHVLARVLRGYNYVFVTGGDRLEVIVVGRVGRAAVAPTILQALPQNTDPAAQWRSETKKP